MCLALFCSVVMVDVFHFVLKMSMALLRKYFNSVSSNLRRNFGGILVCCLPWKVVDPYHQSATSRFAVAWNRGPTIHCNRYCRWQTVCRKPL